MTRVDTARGSTLLKWNATAPSGFFDAEVEGLRALGAAALASGARLIVPEPLFAGETDAGAWLLTQYVETGDESHMALERLGHGLALLHGETGHEPALPLVPGWPTDNWIGTLPQANSPVGLNADAPDSRSEWARFWVGRRLAPQIDMARNRGLCQSEIFDEVVELTPTALPHGLPVGLLHGDLWSGNYLIGTDRVPAIFDPAVFLGHGEVDLAMSELFGDFGPDFYSAYNDVRPISSEYHAFRKELYQLYYLLVHVILFGVQYEPLAYGNAARVVRALR